MTGRVLVLDGNQRSALAATRALGKKDIEVIVGESELPSLAGSSKYCRQQVIYPSPYDDSEKFIHELASIVRKMRIDVLFPITDISIALVLYNREIIAGPQVPWPSAAIFDSITNKYRLFQLAESLGVKVPATIYIKGDDSSMERWEGLKFPVVIKPAYSKAIVGNKWLATSVRYASTHEELRQIVADSLWYGSMPFLVQEYVEGEGQGVFALYNRGKPVTFFAHRRLREKPPSGGVSVLSESVQVRPDMRDAAEKLLSASEWHGVAMVEFKVASDGVAYLMEINGRFWGSLQLAIDSGINFPYMLYQLAMGNPIEVSTPYEIGRKNRWLLGDMDNLYLIVKGQQRRAQIREVARAVTEFMKLYQPKMSYEINRLHDMRPFLFELQNYFRSLK